jgi:hypothetical protein
LFFCFLHDLGGSYLNYLKARMNWARTLPLTVVSATTITTAAKAEAAVEVVEAKETVQEAMQAVAVLLLVLQLVAGAVRRNGVAFAPRR